MIKYLFALLLVSCAGIQQTLDPGVFYKRDIQLEINGGTYTGVTVVPNAESYDITLVPPGAIDMMLIRSCHREYTVEKQTTGWGLFNKKSKFTYKYTPIKGLEDTRVCPLRVDVYESDKQRHSWAMLDFENPVYSLPFTMVCNGDTHNFNGVGVCQSKEKTIQKIKFNEPIRFAPQPTFCNAPIRVGDGYEIKSEVGECLYTFDTRDGKIGRMTIIGYSGVLIREAQ